MKKVILSSVGLCLCLSLFAQSDTTIKMNRLQFGFSLGSLYSKLVPQSDIPENASFNYAPGLRLGILADYRVAHSFYITPKVELAFNESNVVIQSSTSTAWYHIMSTSLELMAHFTLKKENGSFKPYVFAGPDLKLDMAQLPENASKSSRQKDLAIDFGIGLEHAAPYFNFAPELRYSYGLLDVNPYPNLPPLNLHTVSIVFNFKG